MYLLSNQIMIIMNKVVVFGNDHTNSVGVIQSLGIAGYKSVGLLFGYKSGIVASSKYTVEIITAKDAQTCIEKLLNNIQTSKEKIPIIACCDIAALTLERNVDRLKEYFLFEYATNYSLEFLSRKENQVRLATVAGFNVPISWNLQDAKDIPNDITFPCIIKPLVSCEGAKSDIRVCRTKTELEQNLNTLGHTKNVLLQQYIDRDYEISILGCSLPSGQCIIPVVENKLTLYPKYVGLECLVNMQPLEECSIKASIENLISITGYVGLFSIEMMHCKETNKFYFTEINLRNDGAEALVTKYGANLPLNHVEDLLGLPLTKQKDCYPGYYIWDMHHFLSLIHMDINIITWIKEIKKSNGFMLYFKEDRKPFFKQYTNWILSKFRLRKNETYK